MLFGSLLVPLSIAVCLQAAPVITQCTLYTTDRGAGAYRYWYSGSISTYMNVIVDVNNSASFYTSFNEGPWTLTTMNARRDITMGATKLIFTGGITGEGYLKLTNPSTGSYGTELYDSDIYDFTPTTTPEPIYQKGDWVLGAVRVTVVWSNLASLTTTGDSLVTIVPQSDYDGALDEPTTEVDPQTGETPYGNKTETNNIFQIKLQPISGDFKKITSKPVTKTTTWNRTVNLYGDYWNNEEFTAIQDNPMVKAKNIMNAFLVGITTLGAFLMVWQEFKK